MASNREVELLIVGILAKLIIVILYDQNAIRRWFTHVTLLVNFHRSTQI